MKHSQDPIWNIDTDQRLPKKINLTKSKVDDEKFVCVTMSDEKKSLRNMEFQEKKLRNTFGWARIDVLTMLIVFIFLASLSFSLLVEALQTLIHIDHQDTMHLPVPVIILGFLGLILNGICYLLIGGYTTNQSSFLHMTSDGDVILNSESIERKLPQCDINNMDENTINFQKEKQSLIEIFRDVSSTMFVIICAIIVYMSKDNHTAKFIDPIISIFSCVVLVTLSFPYMKESCLILLQTIPASIDIDIFEKKLVAKFQEIISYHDLHIWQLTSNKFVSTVHIKFKSQQHYANIIGDVRNFFIDQGINIVTIQPEFQDIDVPEFQDCLVQCNKNDCMTKLCCQQSNKQFLELKCLNKDFATSEIGSDGTQQKKSYKLNPNSRMERSQSANNIICSKVLEVPNESIFKKSSKELSNDAISSTPNINFS